MRKAKYLILLFMVIIAGSIGFTLWVNLKEKRAMEEKEKLPAVSTGGADVRLEKIHFVEDKHGNKTWELEANCVKQYSGENLMVVEQVKVTLYSKDDRIFVISGNQAKFHPDSKDMDLVGDVLLSSSDGYRLKTQSLSYRHGDKKVTTPDIVEIEGEQLRLRGKGMLVDIEEKRFKVLGEVRTWLRGGFKG